MARHTAIAGEQNDGGEGLQDAQGSHESRVVPVAMTVKNDRVQRLVGGEFKRTRIVIGSEHLVTIRAQHVRRFRETAGEVIQAQNRRHKNLLLSSRPGFRLNTDPRHPELDQVEQSLQAHAALEHADQIVDREADLLAGLNQPLDSGVNIFVMRLVAVSTSVACWRS